MWENHSVKEIYQDFYLFLAEYFTVLNAKQHEKEAEIVAMAGQKSRVTIATNMTGHDTNMPYLIEGDISDFYQQDGYQLCTMIDNHHPYKRLPLYMRTITENLQDKRIIASGTIAFHRNCLKKYCSKPTCSN